MHKKNKTKKLISTPPDLYFRSYGLNSSKRERKLHEKLVVAPSDRPVPANTVVAQLTV